MSAIGRDRAVEIPFGRDRVIAFAIAAIAMIVLVAPHLDYVPLWDGRVYANCVMDAAFNGVSMESLRCANHPSQGWAFTLVLPQLVDPGNVALLNGTNLALGLIAIAAIRVVLARAFPDGALGRELDLVALACAVHPVVLSTLLQPNVDFGVYVFFFVALAGLLSPGALGTFVAVVAGTLAVFSKETAVGAYGLAVAITLAIEHVKSGRSLREEVRPVIRRGALLSIPVVLFVLHVLDWNTSHKIGAIWKHGWQKSSTDGFNFFDMSEPIFLTYAAGLFVLGFMWVVMLPIIADTATGLARMAKRMPAREVEGADRTTLVALTVLTFVLTYVLTSFRTWSNLRYFALLYPLLLLMAYAGMHRMRIPATARKVALVAVVALFVLADYRSVDPLSRAVYGTFDTGVRRMYWMTSITGEFEGPGRDQLVYNLEFTGYHDVQNALYAQIKPTTATVIGTPRHVRWNIWTQLDATNYTRTMRRRDVVVPTYADEVDIPARGAVDAWFLDFSNHGRKDNALEGLLGRYRIVDSLVVTAGGQKVTARHLVRREAPMLPSLL